MPWFDEFILFAQAVPWFDWSTHFAAVLAGLTIGYLLRRPKPNHDIDIDYIALDDNYEPIEDKLKIKDPDLEPPPEPEPLPVKIEEPKVTRRSMVRDEWRQQIRSRAVPSTAVFSHEFEGAFTYCGFRKKGLGAGKQRLEIDGDALYFNGIQEHIAPHTVQQIKSQLMRERAALEESK